MNGSVVKALGEAARFHAGERVRLVDRSPIGHYRVPTYLRNATGRVEAVIEPPGIDNEEEGYGRNAGERLHYYRIAVSMTSLWPGYAGSPRDGIRVEVFESWLEKVDP